MSGKVSTTNYKESLETGKEYLDYNFIKTTNNLKIPSKIKRCKWCARVLNYLEKDEIYDSLFLNTKGYCSGWCYENDNLPIIKNVCKVCGNVTQPIYNKKGKKNGAYRMLCNKCIIEGKSNKPVNNPKSLTDDELIDIDVNKI